MEREVKHPEGTRLIVVGRVSPRYRPYFLCGHCGKFAAEVRGPLIGPLGPTYRLQCRECGAVGPNHTQVDCIEWADNAATMGKPITIRSNHNEPRS